MVASLKKDLPVKVYVTYLRSPLTLAYVPVRANSGASTRATWLSSPARKHPQLKVTCQ